MTRSTAPRSSDTPLRLTVPPLSIHTGPGPLIITSFTDASARSGSKGPRPCTRATTRATTSSTTSVGASGASVRTIPAMSTDGIGTSVIASITLRCTASTSAAEPLALTSWASPAVPRPSLDP